MLESLRLAIIGCGAVADVHLAAARESREVVCTALFDIVKGRAEATRQRNSLEHAIVASDISEVIQHADVAIVATSSASHAAIAMQLLRSGLHVLCEKPLALSSIEAEELVATAASAGRLLSCGFARRFAAATELAQEAIRSDLLGELSGVDIVECVSWYWSKAAFDRSLSGGGVLFDTGPHIFDALTYLLGGKLELLEYRDNANSGVESTAHVRLLNRHANGSLPVTAILTRSGGARSVMRVHGERASLELRPHVHDAVQIRFAGSSGTFPVEATRPAEDPFLRQLVNLVGAVQGREALRAPASEAVAGIRLIEECYRRRQALAEPWTTEPRIQVESRPRRVLLTGSTGNVGSRAVELWARSGRLETVRCMIRSYRTAERVMRFPAQVVEADLLDRAALERAMKGCDAVVHLAAGDKPGEETKALLDVARRSGVQRFVHMSSACVYGIGIPEAIEARQEQTPLARTGELYADGKASAERAVERAEASGPDVVVLRPHVVYGPGMRWSDGLMRLLLEQRVRIVQPEGICNLIYIDDLVGAIERALDAQTKSGCYFVSDGEPRSWGEYVEAHARLLGVRVPRLSFNELPVSAGTWRGQLRETSTKTLAVLRSAEFKTFLTEAPLARALLFRSYLWLRDRSWARPRLERLKGRSPILKPSPSQAWDVGFARLQTSRARLSATAAADGMHFRAGVTFDEGMRRSLEWFRAHGLLGAVDRASS